MPSEGNAIRISTDCYRLVARLRGQSRPHELNGFTSIPEAQTKVADFVIAATRLGEVTELYLERRSGSVSPGVSSAAAPSGEVVKRWNNELVRRIVLQNCDALPPREPAAPMAEASVLAPIADRPDTIATPPDRSDIPISHAFAPFAVPSRDLAPLAPTPAASPIESVRSEPQPRVESTAQHATPQLVLTRRDEKELNPLHELADVVGGGALTGTVLMDLPADSSATRPRELRPPIHRSTSNHRRTRWETALAIAFVAIVALGILLLDTDGDPLGLFKTRATTTAPRESLPFPVRPPAGRPVGEAAISSDP